MKTVTPSYEIAGARQARCRARLEFMAPGPTLPLLGDRPRHYVDARGHAYAWNGRNYVSID